MATRGRKPKPTAMKELEGNPGKHPLNTSEPKPNKKAPACPKWLEPEAKKEWRRLAKQMEAIGILTEVDMAAFAGYCQAYARWKEAEEFITQHGTIPVSAADWHPDPDEHGMECDQDSHLDCPFCDPVQGFFHLDCHQQQDLRCGKWHQIGGFFRLECHEVYGIDPQQQHQECGDHSLQLDEIRDFFYDLRH